MKFANDLNLEYEEAASTSSFGELGSLGIKVFLSLNRPLTDKENGFVYEKLEEIKKMIFKNNIQADPQRMEYARKEKEDILACFPDPVYVKEIPNGYCNDYCCVHKPWFIVTTKIGPITIGWRKRVISISWKDTDNKQNAEEIFPNEDTTKDGTLIHAWGYDKAKEYINLLLTHK